MAASPRGPTGNLFLDHMPALAMDGIAESMVKVTLKQGELISDEYTAYDRVLFPINGVISVVLDMSNGDTAEVGIIGREGMTGLVIALGQRTANQRSVVQIPNGAMCVSTEAFSDVMAREPELKSYALRYGQAVLGASARLSACNALHAVNERCARWLLMAHDRVGKDLLLLTQEFLSQMLGVRRASVAIAASELQEAGLISYSRGHITILNRRGLESGACECYDAMDREWNQIMKYTARDGRATAVSPNRIEI